jgi:hypothetical protein
VVGDVKVEMIHSGRHHYVHLRPDHLRAELKLFHRLFAAHPPDVFRSAEE